MSASLEARALEKGFGGAPAVAGLSFRVAPGELYGLVGPDGAGKTTTMRMLAGLAPPDSGEALVLGRSVVAAGAEVRELLGYMPQQYSLYGDLSVWENLRFFGDLFGLTRAEIKARTDELLAITRLERFRGRRADALSGGMYKKLALSCALLHRPRVLLLDEPSNGVDPVSRRELWELLHGFVDGGMAVLLATPYMDEAARCHRVGLLAEGRLLAEGAPEALVQGLVHDVVMVHAPDRAAAEDALHERAEVLALSPHGSGLRLVVRQGQREALARWAAGALPAASFEPATPDFEDVYLGLVAG